MLKPTVLTACALVLLAIADPGRAQAALCQRDAGHDPHFVAGRRRAARREGRLRGHFRAHVRRARPRDRAPGESRRVPEEGHAARHRVGQRRLRDRQQELHGFHADGGFARLPRDRHGADRRCGAAASERRRPAQRDRLGGQGERARRVAAQGQDRDWTKWPRWAVRAAAFSRSRWAPTRASRRSACSTRA